MEGKSTQKFASLPFNRWFKPVKERESAFFFSYFLHCPAIIL